MAELPDDARELGAWLAEIRTAAGLTQSDLSQAAGVATRTIQRWEAGTHAPVDVIRVLTALGVKFDPPEPENVRALNVSVEALRTLLGEVDVLQANALAAEPAPSEDVLRRLAELEATVEKQGKSMTAALRELTRLLEPAAEEPARPARRARKGA